MKINESKHGFVVKKKVEVSELNAIMYEMEHIKYQFYYFSNI